MSTALPSNTQPQRMQCMEVWGGNLETDRVLEMPGLRVRLSSHAYGAAQGGGDVYYVSACASGRITRFLLADISGHGEEVSQTAIRLRDLMRKNVNVVKQRRLVEWMNEQFGDVAGDGHFATALVCTYFSPTRSLQWSNAGHPPPFLFTAADKSWRVLDRESRGSQAADIPLGINEQTRFNVSKIKLEPGDFVVCYSDAFIEAVDSNGRGLGVAGLLRILQDLDPAPETLIDNVRSKLTAIHADNLSGDDATMAVLQCVPGRTTLKDNLLAALRVLRPVRDATHLRPR